MEKIKKDLFAVSIPVTFVSLNDGQGTTLYNHNIRAGEQNGVAGNFYDSLVVLYPLSANSVLKQLISANYPSEYESKLQNDYSAAIEGIEPVSKKTEYLNFLAVRKTMRASVDADCLTNNVPLI